MTLPLYASFIDGKTVECAQSFFDLVTPQDGRIIGRIAESGRDGVEIAVKAASLAFARHRRQPTHVRIGWLKAADDFDVGALWVNEATRFRLDGYPFGGVKRSGVGREGVRYAIEELSQMKFIGMTV